MQKNKTIKNPHINPPHGLREDCVERVSVIWLSVEGQTKTASCSGPRIGRSNEELGGSIILPQLNASHNDFTCIDIEQSKLRYEVSAVCAAINHYFYNKFVPFWD